MVWVLGGIVLIQSHYQKSWNNVSIIKIKQIFD
jgi:hypothetical protein